METNDLLHTLFIQLNGKTISDQDLIKILKVAKDQIVKLKVSDLRLLLKNLYRVRKNVFAQIEEYGLISPIKNGN